MSDESHLPTQARLRGANVTGIRAIVELSDAVGRSGTEQKVDAQYAVIFTTADGRQEIWDTMTARAARSAAQDLEYEMEQDGYRGRAASDQLPIAWRIGPLLEAHPDRARIDS